MESSKEASKKAANAFEQCDTHGGSFAVRIGASGLNCREQANILKISHRGGLADS